MDYIKELAEWASKNETKKHKSAAKIAFIAIQKDVFTAIDAGYPLKTIYQYEKSKGRITCTYETFRTLVNAAIASKKKSKTEATAPNDSKKGKSVAAEPKKAESPTIGGFSYNPTQNKEELI